MYSSSIFGVSFPDVIGQELGMHYDRKMANWLMGQQKLMAEWQAKNMPKFQREGYEAAGINPLLAYHSGVGSQSLPSAYAMPSHSGQLGGFDASAFQASKKLFTNAVEDEDAQRDANIELTNKEIEKKDAEINAINNSTDINSAREGRSQVLDWLDRIGDIVNPYLFYKLSREKYDDFKKRFPNRNKYSSGGVSTSSTSPNNSSGLFLDVMKKVAPFTLGVASAYGAKKATDKAIKVSKDTETNRRQRSGRYRSVNYGGGIPSFHNVFNR